MIEFKLIAIVVSLAIAKDCLDTSKAVEVLCSKIKWFLALHRFQIAPRNIRYHGMADWFGGGALEFILSHIVNGSWKNPWFLAPSRFHVSLASEQSRNTWARLSCVPGHRGQSADGDKCLKKRDRLVGNLSCKINQRRFRIRPMHGMRHIQFQSPGCGGMSFCCNSNADLTLNRPSAVPDQNKPSVGEVAIGNHSEQASYSSLDIALKATCQSRIRCRLVSRGICKNIV